jgi:8-oxo-dGTP pyrophosphatase MutT (NUDIX family)
VNEAPAKPAFAGLAGEKSAPGSGHPTIRPVPAATMIIVDGAGAEPRVLMGRRHENHVFMPGRYVFPGGRVDASDRKMNVAGALHELVEMRLIKKARNATASGARALALAAIRETYEETGLLIGSPDYGTPEKAPAGAWSDYAAHGLYPELDQLHLIARAITPTGRPRRFDTAFFAVGAASIAGQVEGMIGPDKELVDLVWLPLSRAEKLDMPAITRTVLLELGQRLEAGMSPMLPVPLYYDRRGTWQRELL